jgi:hypothetical protein
LVTPDHALLGALPPFQTEVSWWPEAWDIVRGARERHSIDVTLLRLLETESGVPVGGRLTYLAEMAAEAPVPADLRPWPGSLPEHPLRMSWALAPVAAARQALIYQNFLDNIEPSEHPYHATDPAEWLSRTAELVRQAG